MAVNKVVINDKIALDLTQDNVTPDTLFKGTTAHDASGNPIEGTADLTLKQDKITASGILKGNGDGRVTAATPGTDYLRYAEVNARLNRTTDVHTADSNYTTYMARGESLNTVETTPTVNGCIAWLCE